MDGIEDTPVDKNVKKKIVWDLGGSNNQNVKILSRAEILNKRKERFGEISPPKPKYNKISHKQATNMNSSNGADFNILKRRSERFGENVSTLMKKLEHKEKLKMRQARFSSTPTVPSPVNKNVIEGARQDSPSTVKIFQTIDQIDAERRVKITFEK